MAEQPPTTLRAFVRMSWEAGTRPSIRLRDNGLVPSVITAFNTNRRELLALEERDVNRLFHAFQSEFTRTQPIELLVANAEDSDMVKDWSHDVREADASAPNGSGPHRWRVVRAILRDHRFHPVTDHVEFCSFQHLPLGKKVTLRVPVRIEGDDMIPKNTHVALFKPWLPVRCSTSAVPAAIVMDVSDLKVNRSVRVANLATPEEDGCAILADDDVVVAKLVPTLK